MFHEASHGLGLFPVLIQPLNQITAEQKVTVPPQLWHAVLFYTAGELTRRELTASGIDYTEYAGPGFTTTCAAPAAGTRSPSTGRRISTASGRSRTRSPGLVATFK